MKKIIATILVLVMSISFLEAVSCFAVSKEENIRNIGIIYDKLSYIGDDERFYDELLYELTDTLGFSPFCFKIIYEKDKIYYVLRYEIKDEYSDEFEFLFIDRHLDTHGSVANYAIPLEFYEEACPSFVKEHFWHLKNFGIYNLL